MLLPIVVQALFLLDVVNDTTSLEFFWTIFYNVSVDAFGAKGLWKI